MLKSNKYISPYIKSQLISQIRRVCGWAENRKECKARTKRAPYIHQCEGCARYICVRPTGIREQDYKKSGADEIIEMKMHVDHINPVVPLEGFDWDFNKLIARDLTDKLQHLCIECHNEKTAKEKVIRDRFRNEKK